MAKYYRNGKLVEMTAKAAAKARPADKGAATKKPAESKPQD